MKKLLAFLLSIILLLSFCACELSETDDLPIDDRQQGQKEPEETKAPEKQEPPIEVSEFCPEEDMPNPFDEGSENSDFTSETSGVTVGERTFNLEWIYYHNIHDWVTAGITYDDGVELANVYINMGLTKQATDAIKQKLSDFTLITMWESDSIDVSAMPTVTVGDEVYDIAWLSSHNATEYKKAGIPAAMLKCGKVSQENFVELTASSAIPNKNCASCNLFPIMLYCFTQPNKSEFGGKLCICCITEPQWPACVS